MNNDTTSIRPLLCRDCINFQPATAWEPHQEKYYTHGRCTKFISIPGKMNLVSGTQSAPEYWYAEHARDSEQKCGIGAVMFLPKDTTPEPDNEPAYYGPAEGAPLGSEHNPE